MERMHDANTVPGFLFPDVELFSAVELAARSGMTLIAAKTLWRSLGFPEVDENTPYFSAEDLAALNTVQKLIEEDVIDLEGAIRLGRLIGTASARIAEAGIAALHERGSESALEHMELEDVVDRMESILGYAWRRQLHAALVRFDKSGRTGQSGPFHREMGVGFADLAGFTERAATVSLASLAYLTRQFEEVTSLAISSVGGRVIKLIGDGVMFVAETPEELVACADGVKSVCGADSCLPSVRIGLAWGELLLQNGDYFGPDVNLASRMVSSVPVGVIALSNSLHRLLGPSERWENILLKNIKGLGDCEVWIDRVEHAN